MTQQAQALIDVARTYVATLRRAEWSAEHDHTGQMAADDLQSLMAEQERLKAAVAEYDATLEKP